MFPDKPAIEKMYTTEDTMSCQQTASRGAMDQTSFHTSDLP